MFGFEICYMYLINVFRSEFYGICRIYSIKIRLIQFQKKERFDQDERSKKMYKYVTLKWEFRYRNSYLNLNLISIRPPICQFEPFLPPFDLFFSQQNSKLKKKTNRKLEIRGKSRVRFSRNCMTYRKDKTNHHATLQFSFSNTLFFLSWESKIIPYWSDKIDDLFLQQQQEGNFNRS